MSEHPEHRLSRLHIPPGFRVTIHLGEKPEPAFPDRPRAFGPPPPSGYPDSETSVPEPTVRVDVFRDGRAIGSTTMRLSDLDSLPEFLEIMFDDPDDDAPRRYVEVYCSGCGYNLMENVDTGAKAPMILYMTAAQIADVESPDAKCGICGGQMAVRDVPEPPKSETKVYQFPKRD